MALILVKFIHFDTFLKRNKAWKQHYKTFNLLVQNK